MFEPYDASQIREILQNRTDAFAEGVLDDGVIPRAAALSAKEHGDARKAMRLLRYAGDQANKENADRVKESHLSDARASAEVDRLLELISGLPPHSKHVLIALANLTKNQPEREWFRTMKIRETYLDVCEQSGADPLSAERTRQLLNELCFQRSRGADGELAKEKDITASTPSCGTRISYSLWMPDSSIPHLQSASLFSDCTL
ncbi:hypothetical protein ACFQH8_21970 [Halomicroarcula sp. GCM10025710]